MATLPYDATVIARVKAWRAAGGQTALVTASGEKIAQEVGAHLDLFDDVFGSDGTENLKGEARRVF